MFYSTSKRNKKNPKLLIRIFYFLKNALNLLFFDMEEGKLFLKVSNCHSVLFGHLKYSDCSCVTVTAVESVTCREISVFKFHLCEKKRVRVHIHNIMVGPQLSVHIKNNRETLTGTPTSFFFRRF